MALPKKTIDQTLHFYSAKEEKLNIYSHAFGVVLSLFAIVLLFFKALKFPWFDGMSLIIYAISQLLIFTASTYYHAQTKPKKRYFANILDHSMIYVSISGTYSPLCIIALKNDGGLMLFLFIWVCTLIGILLKTKFTGKFNLLSTILYIALGWIIVFYWPEICNNLSEEGINWLIIGGISYTIGAVLYMIERLPYNHALFHLFILIGAISHFITIYFYV